MVQTSEYVPTKSCLTESQRAAALTPFCASARNAFFTCHQNNASFNSSRDHTATTHSMFCNNSLTKKSNTTIQLLLISLKLHLVLRHSCKDIPQKPNVFLLGPGRISLKEGKKVS